MAEPKLVSELKPFLLRLPKPLLEAYQRWAEDELRSLNGQIEYVLRKALKEEGRMPKVLDKPGDKDGGKVFDKHADKNSEAKTVRRKQ